MKSNKGSGVVILNQELYNNAIEELISEILNSKSSMKTQQ